VSRKFLRNNPSYGLCEITKKKQNNKIQNLCKIRNLTAPLNILSFDEYRTNIMILNGKYQQIFSTRFYFCYKMDILKLVIFVISKVIWLDEVANYRLFSHGIWRYLIFGHRDSALMLQRYWSSEVSDCQKLYWFDSGNGPEYGESQKVWLCIVLLNQVTFSSTMRAAMFGPRPHREYPSSRVAVTPTGEGCGLKSEGGRDGLLGWAGT